MALPIAYSTYRVSDSDIVDQNKVNAVLASILAAGKLILTAHHIEGVGTIYTCAVPAV